MTHPPMPETTTPQPIQTQRVLTPAAKRALEEAEARRRVAESLESLPPEQGGREGAEPVRYGDWENKGIASDF